MLGTDSCVGQLLPEIAVEDGLLLRQQHDHVVQELRKLLFEPQ